MVCIVGLVMVLWPGGYGTEQTAAQWGCAPQVGNATLGGPNAQWKQNSKYYIIHRQQTDLYLGLPYTEDTGQINLDNVTYKM